MHGRRIISLIESVRPATTMRRITCGTLCYILPILVLVYQASAHQSFRIASMIRGIDVNDTRPETVGGTSHECYRTCVAGDVRTCVYSFTLMDYTTMSSLCGDCPHTREDCFRNGCITAGGEVRQVALVNRMLPGPSIQVCEGDTVQVDVINAFTSESASIHWHGLHQVGTPHMDGVPHLTQCPINPNNRFKYNFTANPAGTHMWHSHSGFQEADGIHGSFVVRVADDPLSRYYDYDSPEHIMTIWHWFNTTSGFVFHTVPARRLTTNGHGLTINGLAAIQKYEQDGAVHMTPRAEFTVTKGYRYRFRSLSNAAVYCPVQVSVDNHTMRVIASDGAAFEPVEVDSFIINAGERYDFVLFADQEVGNYWIRYRGFGECAFGRGTVSGEAILRYSGADDADPPGDIGFEESQRSGVLLNPVEESTADYSNHSLIHLAELNGTMSGKPNVSGTPDHIIYLEKTIFVYNEFRPPRLTHQFNKVSFEFPPIPFLTQYENITSDMFCTEDDDTAKDCFGAYCACPYVHSVDAGSLVEIVIVNTAGGDQHPLHLHGQYFQIVTLVAGNKSKPYTVDEVRGMNEAGLIEKKLDRSPLKDTVGLPNHGIAVLRFVANNPGYWFFHCHVAKHLDQGQSIVIKTGKHSEMVKRPANFPTCGNYDVIETSPQAA